MKTADVEKKLGRDTVTVEESRPSVTEKLMRTGNSALWIMVAALWAAIFVPLTLETVASSSPMRWYALVFGILTASAVCLIWMWPGYGKGRLGAPVFAALLLASTFCLLSLGLYTFPYSESLFSFMGEGTSFLLLLLLSLGVFAGAVSVLFSVVPLSAKIVVVVLAAYSVSAAIFALGGAHDFDEFLRGSSFIEFFPSYLQGGPLGVLVLLPAFVFFSLYQSARGWSTNARKGRIVYTLALLGTTVAMLGAFTNASQPSLSSDVVLTSPALIRNPELESSGGKKLPDVSSEGQQQQEKSANQVVETAEDSDTISESSDGNSPPEVVSPDKIALSVEQLVGVLGSKPQALIEWVEQNVTFSPYGGVLRGAEGTLLAGDGNSADRAELLSALLSQAGYRVRFAWAELPEKEVEKLAEHLVGEHAVPTSEQLPPLVDSVMGNAGEQFLVLGDLLQASGYVPREISQTSIEEVRSLLKTHYWVQYEDRGEWRDAHLLPTGPTEAELFPGQTGRSLPPELLAKIKLALFRGESLLLTQELLTSEVVGSSLGLYYEQIGTSLEPRLIVGEREIKARRFPSPLSSPSSKSSKGLFGIMNSLPSSLEPQINKVTETAEKKRAEIVPQRLAITLAGPGYTESHSFPVVLGHGTSTEERDMAALEGFHGFTFVVGLPGRTQVAKLKEDITSLQTAKDLAEFATLLAFAYETFRSQMPASYLREGVKRFTTRPNLRSVSVLPEKDKVAIQFDLSIKSYLLASRDDSSENAAHPFYDYVANGLIDHASERALFGKSVAVERSAGALLDAVISGKGELAFSYGAGSSFPQYVPLQGKERIEEELREGNAIVLPQNIPEEWSSTDSAWWSIAENGFTEDSNIYGFHTPQTDYAIKVHQRASWAKKVKNLGCAIGVVVAGAGGQIGEAMTMTGNPEGAAISAVAEALGTALEMLGKQGCKGGAPGPVSGPGVRGMGFGRPNRGFNPIGRAGSRRPWRHGGRVFPAR